MSKWTEIRDNIVDALHVDKVTEELKQRCYWRDAIVLPSVMQGAVWLIKTVLDKSLTPTIKA